jgi:hypothetical protein
VDVEIANLAAALSVLVAAAAIYLSSRQALKERQLSVALSLGAEYREAWRERWYVIPEALKKVNGDIESLPSPISEVVLDALNWLDWFGTACKEKVIQRPDFVFRTVGPSMSLLIQCGQPTIARSNSAYGDNYWSGVAFISKRLSELGIYPYQLTRT